MIQFNGTSVKFEQAFHHDHRACDCPIPMNLKKWNDALGRMCVLRVCCMAKALEDLTGIDLLQTFEFDPKWEWDCDTIQKKEDEYGEVKELPQGLPPLWLEKRLIAKALPIHNATKYSRNRRIEVPSE